MIDRRQLLTAAIAAPVLAAMPKERVNPHIEPLYAAALSALEICKRFDFKLRWSYGCSIDKGPEFGIYVPKDVPDEECKRVLLFWMRRVALNGKKICRDMGRFLRRDVKPGDISFTLIRTDRDNQDFFKAVPYTPNPSGVRLPAEAIPRLHIESE